MTHDDAGGQRARGGDDDAEARREEEVFQANEADVKRKESRCRQRLELNEAQELRPSIAVVEMLPR